MKTVSVIIPAYNRAAIIEDALNSVFEQTHRPLELVVIDDSSTDNTVEVVREWIASHRASDSTFEAHVFTQPNKRAPAARNLGTLKSTGDYIQFLDSDDVLYPETIKQKIDAIRQSGLPYAYCANDFLDSKGQVIGRCGSPWPESNQGAIATYLFHTSGPLIPRSAFDAVGLWDESLVATDEIELFGRLKIHLGRGAYLPEFGHAQRDHEGDRVSRSGGIGPDPSAREVIKKLFTMVQGTGWDNPTERNAIARFGCGVVEAYALSEEYALAVESLQLSKNISTGKRRNLLSLFLMLERVIPRKLFFPLYLSARGRMAKKRSSK